MDKDQSETVDRSELDLNKNTEFLHGRGWWFFYAAVIILSRYILYMLMSLATPKWSHYSFTLTHTLHALITIYAMHWVKGEPFIDDKDQGSNNSLTFWEQIEYGSQHTTTKKLLTAVPILLCLAACSEADWEVNNIMFNGVVTFCAVLGKLPFMHRQRLFGINKDD